MNQKKFEELEIRDDFMFGKVMQNKDLCRQTLEILLGITIEDINYPEKQKIIDITYKGKSIRLDIYVEDDKGIIYDAEMQNVSSDSQSPEYLSKRSRYYQGMIDLNLIEKGVPYIELNKTYVIFICTFDPFGKNRYCYTFKNRCEEDDEVELRDDVIRIFFNTKGNTEDIPEKAKQLLHYIETKETTNDFTRILDTEVERVKQNKLWRREYMKEFLHDFDVREEGRSLGKAEGKAEGIAIGQLMILDKLLAAGKLSIEEAADTANMTVEELRETFANQLQPV